MARHVKKPKRYLMKGHTRTYVVIGADGSRHPVLETSPDRALAAVADGILFGMKRPFFSGTDAQAASTSEWCRASGMRVVAHGK